MSYLGPLRLHFAGRFQAAPSTVNNDPTHFDTAKFLPSFQKLETASSLNGWWNPRGDADFRLINCSVTSAFLADGSPALDDDPVRQSMIADSDRAAPAKMVDLDSCQQLVTMLFGLEIRVAERTGATLAGGAFEPAAFFDIWNRAPGRNVDVSACAYWQSVLTGVEWGDVSSSPFLTALRDASRDGMLSIKFMMDGYNNTFGDAEFTRGRIVGTVGPGSAAEPRHMVRGRQFVTSNTPGAGGFFVPVGGLNFSSAVVDEVTAKVYLDLGNALPTTSPGGDIASLPDVLSLHVGDISAAEAPLCSVPYQASSWWYEQTAGIVALPADRRLEPAELERVKTSPLALLVNGQSEPAGVEAEVYVRPDQFVFRCDPETETAVRFHATKLGQPYANATISLQQDPSGLQGPGPNANPGQGQYYGADWQVGQPESAVSFPSPVTTDGDGVAVVTVTTSDPKNPREYIDGQVYGITATLTDGGMIPANPWNFVSLLVWSGFVADDPVTWYGSLEPIFRQYANLYPIMQDFLDLSSYEDVFAHKELLALAFGLDPSDPNSMPVTRDLSGAKRKAIMQWLSNGLPPGTAPPAAPAPAPAEAAAVTPDSSAPQARDGKAAAAARRISVRRGAH
jgi:hypothetical protein